ncbi:MAG TPA: DUF1178 family protein [Hyphomicrobiaceae bacterium]|nr:DUF1178 family protein [Hyphomicrobiaceae bacterium]
MIRYRLTCKKGHEFEGWFASSAAYDRQAKSAQLSCPTCGSRKISKALMAPNIATRKRKTSARAESPKQAQPDVQRLGAHGELAAAMRKLRAELESKSEYVGKRFPEEARKIHYEEVPARGIHGEATREEAQALHEEGIEFFPLPLLPEDHN